MRNTIRLGKVFGIEIGVDFSWLLIFAVVTWSLAQHYLVVRHHWSVELRWGAALATSFLFFGSVLAHELAHSLVSKAQGIPVPRITLFFFGGASEISEEPRRPWDEFRMAVAGPLTSFVLAAVFGAVWWLSQSASPVVSEISGYLAGINGMLGLFNLLPGFPLDGGRVLRSVAWGLTNNLRRATQIAVAGGVLVAWLMIAVGIAFVLEGYWADGLWIAFMGWFLESAAVQQGQVTVVHDFLKGHTVREVVTTDCPRIMKQLSLDVFFDSVALPSGRRCFTVMDGDKLLGLVTMHRLSQVPRDQWRETHIADVMIPPEKLVTVRLDEELTEVLDKMGQADINQMPVVDNGKFVGMVSRANILAFLRAHADRQRLEGKPRPAA
jgi:Zn-dependent protease/CBS domain-containing protein